MRRLPIAMASLAAIAIASVLLLSNVIGSRAAGTNPDAFSIDMDPSNTPANTATSLGTVQNCARIDENNLLDQDEDVTADTVSIDVTATNIPASNPMITFAYTLNYTEASLTVQSADHNFLIMSAAGGSMLDGSEALPDTNGNNQWAAAVVDTNVSAAESGSGVLSRLTISTDPSATTGDVPLTLTSTAVIDPDNFAHSPDTINNAKVAVNLACDAPPKPHVQGDVDCSGGASPVSATDALKVLRFVAGLSVTQSDPCDDIGTGGPPVQGNVDCSLTGNPVSATDALKILRFVAGLSVTQTEPCNDIGT